MAKRKKKVAQDEQLTTSEGAVAVAEHDDGHDDHDVLVPHDHYEHVFIVHDEEGNDVLVDEHGNIVKLDENDEPIYDDEGLPKVRKRRGKKAPNEKKPRARKVRVTPLEYQQRWLLLRYRGKQLGSRQMLPDGSFVRPYNTDYALFDSVATSDKEVREFLPKLNKKHKKEFHDIVETHALLVNYFYGQKPDFVVTLLRNSTDPKVAVPAIGFATTHKGIPLKSALKLLES